MLHCVTCLSGHDIFLKHCPRTALQAPRKIKKTWVSRVGALGICQMQVKLIMAVPAQYLVMDMKMFMN